MPMTLFKGHELRAFTCAPALAQFTNCSCAARVERARLSLSAVYAAIRARPDALESLGLSRACCRVAAALMLGMCDASARFARNVFLDDARVRLMAKRDYIAPVRALFSVRECCVCVCVCVCVS